LSIAPSPPPLAGFSTWSSPPRGEERKNSPPHLSAGGGSASGRNPPTDFTWFNLMGFTAFNLHKGRGDNIVSEIITFILA